MSGRIMGELWKFFWYNPIGCFLYDVCYFVLPEKIADWLFMWFYEYPIGFRLTDEGEKYFDNLIQSE